MPAPIVFVHDNPEFVSQAASALQDAGYDVASFTDPITALAALEGAKSVEVLITRVIYATGLPHGLALARMARIKKPGIRSLSWPFRNIRSMCRNGAVSCVAHHHCRVAGGSCEDSEQSDFKLTVTPNVSTCSFSVSYLAGMTEPNNRVHDAGPGACCLDLIGCGIAGHGLGLVLGVGD